MKKIRILALILCLLLLVPALIACGDTEKETGTTAAAAQSTTPEETGPDKDHDEIPAGTNYNGEQINLILRTYSERYSSEFLVTEETGDALKDEIYRRQLRVQSRLGIQLNLVEDTYSTSNRAHGPWNAIDSKIASGDAEFDIVAGSNYNAQVNVIKGTYHNLLNIEEFHFDKNYYPQEVISNMKIGNAMFTLTGDISTYLWDSLYVVFFNRQLCENYQLSSTMIYDLVRKGEWTIDKMFELTKDIYVDTNSNSKKDDGDTFGLAVLITSATDGLFSSCNIPIIGEVDGQLDVVTDLDKLSNVVDKFITNVWGTNGVVPISELTSNASDTVPYYEKQFGNGEYGFLTQILYMLNTDAFRNMKDDYGILPYPKYDKDQATYNTYVHDQFTALAIPMTVTEDRLAMVANVLEAMSSDGREKVKPVYYGIALTGKYAKDTGSIEMLDKIFANITMDRGWIFGNPLKGFAQSILRTPIMNNQNNLASTYQTKVDQTKTKLADIVAAFDLYAEN